MRLYLNESSPFARLVLVVAIELGVKDIDLEWVDPWSSPQELLVVNPLCTIPVLALDDGVVLQESLFISRYLIANIAPRNSVGLDLVDECDSGSLARGALGKSLMEVAFRRVVLGRFYAQGGALFDRTGDALSRVLKVLCSGDVPGREGKISLNELCLVVALLYARFRLEDDFNRYVPPDVQSWLRLWEVRQSIDRTDPAVLATKPASVADFVFE